MSFKRMIYLGLAFSVFVLIETRCVTGDAAAPASNPRGKMYAGAASCRSCHQAICDSFARTAHHAATAPGSDKTVLGNFENGKNDFVFDASVSVRMEKRDSGLYQVLYVQGSEKMARRFDIAFGKSKGQTCLYWQGDHVYQLPISYYTSVQNWGTSPGFSILFPPDFSRMIGRNCFECHSSYIKNAETSVDEQGRMDEAKNEAMIPATLVYGIDCERCHGPAARHVEFQTANPTERQAKFITSFASLNNQQKLDACSVCHAGNDDEKIRPRFLFKPGDDLGDYFREGSGGAEMDVHGNQHGLLVQSKCFTQGRGLNCLTCHGAHTDAANSKAVYSQKCMSCHTEAGKNFCTAKSPDHETMKANCIDCHMPQQPSSLIYFQLSGDPKRNSYDYTNHLIGIYADKKK